MTDRYDVRFTRETEKDLDRLRTWRDRDVGILLQLEDDPFLGHTLKGDLKGARSLEFSLPGSGVYRAVYVVQSDRSVCLVVIVGPPENIYTKATRRIRALRSAGLSEGTLY